MQNSAQMASRLNRYADFIIRWRWLVIIATLLLSVFVASGAQFLGFNNDYRVFFSDDNPHLKAFEAQQRTYTKNDNILFVITPNEGDVFSQDVMSAVEKITREAWLLPYALRVDSVSNFQYSRADGDDLIVTDLIEDAQSLTPDMFKEKEAIALKEPFLVGQLLNEEASVTAINVTFQMPQVDMNETPETVAAARAIVDKIESNYPVEVRLSGVVMLSNAFFEASMQDMQTLIPAMYLIIILVMWALLRSIGATISTVLVIFMSMGAAMGAAGWVGIQLTPPSSSATTIIMTLAVADSIHFLVTLFAGMRKGMSRHDAIRYSLRLNMGPIFLTSITTAIGFLSLNFSDAPPFHDLGNMTAFGVMMAFFLSVTLLPALIAVIPVKASASQNKIGIWMENLSEFVIAKRKGILISASLISIALVAAVPLNTFDDNFVGYFDESVQFRADTDYVNEHLTGIYQIQYSLQSGEDYGVSDPAFLKKVNGFVEWFRQQPEVMHVNTFTDTFKRINKNMHEDNQDYYSLPDDKELSAQYLLLYELSLPEGLDLNNQMDIGKSSTQVIVTLQDMPSSEIAAVGERGRLWLEENHQLESYGVGPAVMFAYISATNMKNMLTGTFFAIIVISILITLSLHNLRIGALSLVPNLLPLAAAFGAWGFLVGEVNVAVSMVSGMALGIVVDDSVHFLSKYLRARREEGLDREGAVRYAFSTVGIALIVTSIILVAGFAVLGQSNFGMNSSMAALTAIAVLMALIADFLLLPVLLLKLDQKAPYPAQHKTQSNTESLEETLPQEDEAGENKNPENTYA